MDKTRRELLIGGSGLAVGGSVGFATGMTFEEIISDDSNSNSQDENTLELISENRPRLGDSNAPVKMYYWSDYQCPFCFRFEIETLPSLRSTFVETGDVELITKPLNVFGDGSYLSALGSHCVFEQVESTQNWFEWHNMLYETFETSGSRNNGWASAENQQQYAAGFDFVDGTTLQSCIQNETYSDRLQADQSEARDQGFEGTPFFVLYNTETTESTTITGAQPTTLFEGEIENILTD